jgi:hypothetical protein
VKYLLVGKVFLSVILLFLFFAVSAPDCGAATINCHVDGSSAGQTSNGKQLIVFDATFRNISNQEYVSRVNSVDVEVHGYFRGREEKYTRKVDVDWNFSPALRPGESKSLKIKFYRSVQPQQGSYSYDNVQIKVLNINFRRAN